MRKNSFLLILIILSSFAYSQQNEKVIVKYKKYQKFDLGDLSVKGNILTPGDLSIKNEDRGVKAGEFYKRKEFEERIISELEDIY